MLLWGKLISLGSAKHFKDKRKERKEIHAAVPYQDSYYLEAYLSPLLGQAVSPFHYIPVFLENPTSEIQALQCTEQGEAHLGSL